MNVLLALPAKQRALVAIAVLLDGREASDYLQFAGGDVQELKRAAIEVAEMHPDLRMPLIGSVLRDAITQLEKEGAA